MRMKRCKICGMLIPEGSYCKKHLPACEEKKELYAKAVKYNAGLYNTTRWRKFRAEVIRQNPFCVCCGRRDKLQVHHIIPPKGNEALFFDLRNVEVVCIYCHAHITNRETRKPPMGVKK